MYMHVFCPAFYPDNMQALQEGSIGMKCSASSRKLFLKIDIIWLQVFLKETDIQLVSNLSALLFHLRNNQKFSNVTAS